MNRTLYTLLLTLVIPVLLGRLFWRSFSHPLLGQRWREFPGYYGDRQQSSSRTVIFHAVSVGEVHAAVPLIEAFLLKHTRYTVLVTCSSLTGSERINQLFGDRVQHVFLPYDHPGAIGRFLDRFRPELLVILETELWPNLIHCASARGVRVAVVNARLSERSRRGYARLGRLVRDMLGKIDCIAAQTEDDAGRFRSIGMPAAISVTGNIKYDVDIGEVDTQAVGGLRQTLFGDRPVLIAASTRQGEEEKVLAAFSLIRGVRPDLALVLVPRHPERFQSAARLFRKAGYNVALRSNLEEDGDGSADVLVGDTMGDLLIYYGLADIAFVGGSLVDTGCQNIIEPAALGIPVVTGPSCYNFRQVSEQLQSHGAQCVVQDEQGLSECVLGLLENEGKSKKMAMAAKEIVRQRSGATAKTLALVEELLENVRDDTLPT